MKKYRHILTWLLVMTMAFGMVAGCGKKEETGESPEMKAPTAEELVKSAKEVLDGASSMSGKMKMELSMDYKAQGVDAVFEMTSDQDMEMVKEPAAVHMKGTMYINLSGITVDMESYTVEENGSHVTYTGSGGQWMKKSTEAGSSSANVSNTLALMLENPGELVLGEAKEAEGKTLYTVEGRIQGEDLSGLMASTGTLLEDSTDAYADLDAEVLLTVDGKSGVPASISLDFTGSYNALMQASKEEQGFDEVAVTKFKVTMSDYTLNEVQEIAVPEEVKAAAVDMDEPEAETPSENETETRDPEEPTKGNYDVSQDDTGNYILETDWDDSTAVLAVPKGFVYDGSSDKTYLRFNSSENDSIHELSFIYGLYTQDENYGEADLAQYQESSYAYMVSVGDYAEVSFEPVQTVTAAGKTVSYTKLSYLYMGTIYCEEYNAWTVFEDGRMVQCTIKEEAREEACSRIDEATIFETAFSALRG